MRFAVLTFLCLAGVAHGNILSDIWHTIEKPLEGIGEAAFGSLLKNGLVGVFGKRELSHLAIDLHDEVLKWMKDAHDLVAYEMSEIEKAANQPGGDFSDRTHELLNKLQQDFQSGNVENFIHSYGDDIIRQFATMLPKRLESRLWTHTQKSSRKTRGNDILVQMLKNITIAKWFFTMPEMERQFLVAMLDAAEHGHLHDFVEHHTYDRVLVFIDHLPVDEGHTLNHYLVNHLKNENKHNITTVHHSESKRDVTEFLRILSEIYSEHLYSLLDKEDRLFLLEMMDAAEHSKLTDFIADHGMEKITQLIGSIPKESGDKLSAFVTERLKNETQTSGSHHKRSADILLTILKDIHTADVFFHLPEAERQFMLELMDAAEHDHLDAFVSKVGLQRVRDFVKHLPHDYASAMTHYIENHLHHHMTPTTHAPTHNPAIMLTILKDIHTASVFMDLSSAHQSLVLELMEAAETGHITTELTKIGIPKLQDLADHLPSPFKEQFATYVVQHVNMEKVTTMAPHVAERELQDEDVALSEMTEDQRQFYNQLKHAAENDYMKAFILKVGVARVIKFLDSLPDSMSHTVQYLIIREMGEEDNVLKPIQSLKKREHHDHGHGHANIHESIHHLGEHLTQNHGHFAAEHHQFYEELKHAIEHNQLKSFIQHVGADKLYAFLDALPDGYATSLEFHILAELEKEDHVQT